MKNRIYVIIILLLPLFCTAQKRGAVWCFGDSALVNFSDTSNIITGRGRVKSMGSCVAISDSLGSLLFYSSYDPTTMIAGTDPVKVYNANNNLIFNGDSIKGGGWYKELVIIPNPLNDSTYYLFNIGVTLGYGIYYNIIDMKANGGSIDYIYGSHGQPKTITSNGTTTTIDYDSYGRQTALHDPDAGTSAYQYNAYDQLIYQEDNKGNKYDNFHYDLLGRINSMDRSNINAKEGIYSYQYYLSGDNKELLQASTFNSNTGGPNVSQSYEYNKYGQVSKFTDEIAGGKSLITVYDYNLIGNLIKQTYPSGFVTENHYDNKSNLTSITGASVNIWQLNNENAYGQPLDISLGNFHRVSSYNPVNDLLEVILTWGQQTQTYTFDPYTGNLSDRNFNFNIPETFNYDNKNRLTGAINTFNSNATVITNYYDNGNIDTKTDAGTYGYDPGSLPHAVKSLTAIPNPSPISHPHPQDITYNSLNKIQDITEGDLNLTFTYGPDDARFKTVLKDNGNIIKTKYFTVDYEEEITPNTNSTRKLHYISGTDGLAAIYIDDGVTPKLYSVLKDHLGSITGLVDQNGIKEEYSYDAWGRRRNPATGECYTVANTPAFIISRGYTGHEHLDEFGLINMNGRLYDPVLGRMLSPDNYVQAASSTQSYNRYSYCWNNPLRFTDPSGDFIFTLLAAVFCPPLIPLGIAMDIGGAVNSIAHIGKINSVGDFAVAYGIGAAAGAATYYTGGAAFAAAGGTAAGGGGFLAGGVLGGAGYTAGSAVQTLGNGIYFGDAQPTAKEFAIGFGVSVLSAGVLQGINAKIHGRDFWNGSYPDISPISPKPTPTISNSSNTSVISPRQQINQATNNTYSINTYQVSGQPFDGKNINFEIPRPQISSYHSSLELKTDLYHNFPKELDQVIINQGTWSQRISDYVRYNNIGYNFEAPGLFNGVEGTYQIGINGNGIVFHKFFLPFK